MSLYDAHQYKEIHELLMEGAKNYHTKGLINEAEYEAVIKFLNLLGMWAISKIKGLP